MTILSCLFWKLKWDVYWGFGPLPNRKGVASEGKGHRFLRIYKASTRPGLCFGPSFTQLLKPSTKPSTKPKAEQFFGKSNDGSDLGKWLGYLRNAMVLALIHAKKGMLVDQG